jgi:hypothetical protein
MKVYANQIDGKIDRVELRVLRYKKVQFTKRYVQSTLHLQFYEIPQGRSYRAHLCVCTHFDTFYGMCSSLFFFRL